MCSGNVSYVTEFCRAGAVVTLLNWDPDVECDAGLATGVSCRSATRQSG